MSATTADNRFTTMEELESGTTADGGAIRMHTTSPCDGAAEAARAWLPPKPVGDAAELLALAEYGGSGPLPVNVKASSNRIAPEAITAHAARIARGVENSVMISYCRRNASGVKRIYDAFVAQGIDVWIDFEDIPKGVDWWESIKAGIERENVCVFCLSKDSLSNKVCGWELDHMAKCCKKVVPIVVAEDFDWDNVRPDIARLNFVFFFREQDSFEMSFNELCEAIVTDHGYLECHTRLNLRAQEWNRSDRAEALLLRAGHLQAVDVFLEKAAVIEPPPTEVMEDFFMASHEQSLKEERRQALVDSLLLAEDEAAFLHDAGVSEPRSGDAVSRVHTVTRCQYRLASILNSRVMQLVMIAVIMLSVLLGMLALATELLAPPPHEAPRPPPPTDDPPSLDPAPSPRILGGAGRRLSDDDDDLRDDEDWDDIDRKFEVTQDWTLPVAQGLFLFNLGEVALQLVAIGIRRFGRHPGFLLDTFVIVVGALLEFSTWLPQGLAQLLVVLRFWRVGRLVNIEVAHERQIQRRMKSELLRKAADVRRLQRVVKTLRDSDATTAARVATLTRQLNQHQRREQASSQPVEVPARASPRRSSITFTTAANNDSVTVAALTDEERRFFEHIQATGGNNARKRQRLPPLAPVPRTRLSERLDAT